MSDSKTIILDCNTIKNQLMRKITFIVLFSLIGFFTYAQDEIPQNIKNTFTSMYGNADDLFWAFQEGAYVANFQAEKGLAMVYIHPYGDWLETRLRLPLQKLPRKVRDYVYENYQTAEVTFSGEVIQAHQTIYRVEYELPSAIVVKLLNEEGELLKERRIEFGVLDNSHLNLKPLPVKKSKTVLPKDVY